MPRTVQFLRRGVRCNNVFSGDGCNGGGTAMLEEGPSFVVLPGRQRAMSVAASKSKSSATMRGGRVAAAERKDILNARKAEGVLGGDCTGMTG